MNKVIFMGRLTADVETRYSTGENATCIANFNLAVDKKFKKKDDPEAPTADFFRITAIGKLGEFAEKYLRKGVKVLVTGRVENNNYTNKDGVKVYGYQFLAEDIEFCESKKASEENGVASAAPAKEDTKWMDVPEDTLNALPFK